MRPDGTLACSSLEEPSAGTRRILARRGHDGTAPAGADTDPRTGKQVVLAAAPVPKLGFVLAAFNLDGIGPS